MGPGLSWEPGKVYEQVILSSDPKKKGHSRSTEETIINMMQNIVLGREKGSVVFYFLR